MWPSPKTSLAMNTLVKDQHPRWGRVEQGGVEVYYGGGTKLQCGNIFFRVDLSDSMVEVQVTVRTMAHSLSSDVYYVE